MRAPDTGLGYLPRMTWIDDEGVHLPLTVHGAVALEIGGRRVWVFVPTRDGHRAHDGQRLVAWPELLVPRLNGRAHAVLRLLDTGEVLFASPVRLGTGEGPLELNKRLAEITDVVAEVLLPAEQRDDERLRAVLKRYESTL